MEVIIKHSGIFFDEEKIKSLGNYVKTSLYNERKKSYEDTYIFSRSLPGINDMIITEDLIQIKPDNDEDCIKVIKKIPGIEKISCVYYKRYTSRCYQGLIDQGIPNLLPDLPPTCYQTRTTSSGNIEGLGYEISDTLYQSGDSIYFSSNTTIEVFDSPSEETIRKMMKYARTLNLKSQEDFHIIHDSCEILTDHYDDYLRRKRERATWIVKEWSSGEGLAQIDHYLAKIPKEILP